MKKIIPFIFFLITSITVHCQDITIGGKIGGMFTSIYHADLPDNAYKVGLAFGVINIVKLRNHFYLQPELNYEQRGGKLSLLPKEYNIKLEYILTTDYITIPVLCKIAFGQKETFFLLAGPYVGILLNAKERNLDTNLSDGAIIYDYSAEITDNCSPFEFGLNLGTGIAFRFTEKVKLFFDARYFMSLTSVSKLQRFPRNYGFNLNTGLLFNLK